jgi:Protein of unknown function (DUF3953)
MENNKQNPRNKLNGFKLKTLRIIMATMVVIISCYGLFTGNYEMQPYMMYFLSLMILIMGLEKIQKGQKSDAYFNIGIFIFLLFVFFLSF